MSKSENETKNPRPAAAGTSKARSSATSAASKNAAQNNGQHESDSLKDKASQTAAQVSSGVSDAAGTVKETVSSAAASTKETVQDVAATVREKAGEGAAAARERTAEAYEASRDAARRTARYARNTSGKVGRNVEGYFDENPLMIGAVGFFGGLLLGSLLPRSNYEDRYVGPLRDDVARRGIRYGRDLSREARDYAEETIVETRSRLEPETESASEQMARDNTYGMPAGHP